ncbi:hypothetical protein M8J76_016305 [Diaphorina citri]|nr:hypothetical protein M8J75_003028 [Diaphorina citri]KAI5719877.1 hypothetical protein M8J76_016305 [Diaphorina citri]KAI5721767.1 hypothetical protein M8J77_025409 [Diaphorina citri]
MSRRKSNVTKRSEYVALASDEESSIKVQTRKRKHEIESETDNSDDCEWEPIQSNPKMMKINRSKPARSASRTSVRDDHDYDIELNLDSKKHCTNKNALMARRNRIKKKMYVEKLENTIQELQDNFKSMQKQILEQNEVIARVTKENRYLRNVITNSSGLKQILQGVRLAGFGNQVNPVHSTTPASPDANLNQQKVDVTDDFPSSTTSDGSPSLDKWDSLSNVKAEIPVHDYSSNPQLYYDTIPNRQRRPTRDDLRI